MNTTLPPWREGSAPRVAVLDEQHRVQYRTVGLGLGRGKSLQEVLAGMTQVAEGVRTAKSAHDLANKLQVEMPLHSAVYRVLHEGLPVRQAISQLLSRELKSEFSLH